MIERRQIVEMGRRRVGSVLVTLIRTEGSSYRRPGARLLVGHGEATGTISGGCLESEVVRRAEWSVRSGAVVQRYSTLFDDTAEIPYGLGCGGTVDLLVEPTATVEFDALLRAMEASLAGMRSTVVTWLPDGRKPLRRAVLSREGVVEFASVGLGASEIQAMVFAPADEVFVEALEPPQRLVVIGAGEDARPLVSMAALLGWSVAVVDGRSQLARQERFPAAERVLAAEASEAETLDLKPEDAVVLMTHSYEQDRDWLAAVLPIAPRYLGVLGARHRSSLLVSEAAVMTGLTIADCCARIYAPVGLDLGGDGAEAIALAVVAEVQACRMGRVGKKGLGEGEVLEQIARGGVSKYLQLQCGMDGSGSEAVDVGR